MMKSNESLSHIVSILNSIKIKKLGFFLWLSDGGKKVKASCHFYLEHRPVILLYEMFRN